MPIKLDGTAGACHDVKPGRIALLIAQVMTWVSVHSVTSVMSENELGLGQDEC